MSARADFATKAMRAIERELSALIALDGPIRLKRMGEVGHLASLMIRRDRESAHARAMLARAWAALGGGALLERALGDGSTGLEVAAVYLPFARRGLRHQALEAALRYRAAMQSGGLPLPVVAAVVQLGLVSSAALEHVAPGWFAQLPPPWTISAAAAYETAHVIPSLLAVGRMTDEHHRYAATWLPVWTRYFAHLGDLDVVAELMVAAGCIAAPIAERDWQVLAGGQMPDGTVSARRGIPGDFIANAHTTIVAAMACILGAESG